MVVLTVINNFQLLNGISKMFRDIVSVVVILLFAIIFYIFSPRALKSIEQVLQVLEDEIKDRTVIEILTGTAGLILGLIIAFLLSQPFSLIPIPYVPTAISIILYGMLGYLGIKIGLSNKDDLNARFKELTSSMKLQPREKDKLKDKVKVKSIPKILDTSVLIDGRIKEIANSGFIEGQLYIPVFVLEELQHIADSSDDLKRNRGRRGLDIIKEMQENKNLEIVIYQGKYEDIPEVDSKLLQLTEDLKGKIVTNDYNLNKVASVRNISVLNINELANSVKPVYLPGEEMTIQIVKVGKEQNQGLGYLDDGTMIVVESGKDYIGQTIEVLVTSVLQTSAGKMIFAKPIV